MSSAAREGVERGSGKAQSSGTVLCETMRVSHVRISSSQGRSSLELLYPYPWSDEGGIRDLHYPCATAYDDEDKSDEEEDAPAGQAAVGIACHTFLISYIMRWEMIERTAVV